MLQELKYNWTPGLRGGHLHSPTYLQLQQLDIEGLQYYHDLPHRGHRSAIKTIATMEAPEMIISGSPPAWRGVSPC